jgi:RNA polymerase sigma factor (sigma-70 family)
MSSESRDPLAPTGSVTRFIAELKGGEHEAAAALWGRYFERLVRLARRQLGDVPRRIADEEDVALSVMGSLCEGAKRGRFEQLTDREDLWKLLVVITKQKTVDLIRHNTRQKRGEGQVRGESVFLEKGEGGEPAGLDQFFGDEPTPEFLAALGEQHRRLLDGLPDETLRRVALWKMESYTNEEIAEKLGVALATVERKVKRIREKWLKEADEATA